MKYFEVSSGKWALVFHDWQSVCEYAATAQRTSGAGSSSIGHERDGNWYMTNSYEQAVEWLTKGWDKGREMIERYRAPLVAGLFKQVIKREVEYRVTGPVFNTAAIAAGRPTACAVFNDYQHESRSRKIVRLLYNVSASCGVSSDVMAKRGAVVAATVALLEMAGYRCEVWVSAGFEGYSKKRLDCFMSLKEAGQPLHLGRLAFALGNASMFRRIAFRILESKPEVCSVTHEAYGVPVNSDPTLIQRVPDISITRQMLGESHWTSPEAAERWIIGQLAEKGIRVRQRDTI